MKISHRLPFGLRLGLSTSAIVLVILGSLMAFQEHRDILQSRADRELLLSETTTPLKIALERCSDKSQMADIIQEVQTCYLKKGVSDYQIDIVDINGNSIASTLRNRDQHEGSDLFSTVLEFNSPALPSGIGILKIHQNSDKFNYEIQQRRAFWILDLCITGFCIIASLQLLNFFLFTKPLNTILRGIHQMEMGYWGGININSGAFEIKWLGEKFNSLALDLEQTIGRLVKAERKALDVYQNRCPIFQDNLINKVQEKQSTIQTNGVLNSNRESNPGMNSQVTQLEEYLWDKHRLLSTSNPKNGKTHVLAREIWENDVPIAERFGLLYLKAALEDAAFKAIDTEEYKLLHAQLFQRMPLLQSNISKILQQVKRHLTEHNIPLANIQHRIKNAAGIWRKMNEKGLQLNQINDLIAIRIIVPDENTCYLALNVIHNFFEPHPLRFKDYIAKPKTNGYRSIHTSVKYNDDLDFEVQIRSIEMHEHAEQGVASHWKYKQTMNLEFWSEKRLFHWNPIQLRRFEQ